MKRSIFLLLLGLVCLHNSLWAQDGLKIKDASDNILMEAREEGVLITKVTTTIRTSNAASLNLDDNGLMVYDTDTESFWVWKGSQWVEIDGVDLVDDADSDATNEYRICNWPIIY